MPDTAQERTEEATPRRRLQARRKGTVARSNDLVGALVLLALVLVLPSAVSQLGRGFMQSMTDGFRSMPRDLSLETLGPYLGVVVQPVLLGLALILATTVAVGLVANFAQVGFVFSGEALAPNFNKINPASGLKRMFSFSSTFDGLKAAAKSALFMYIGWSAVSGAWPQIVMLGGMSPLHAMVTVGEILKGIAIRIAFAWLALAAIDYFVQRKQVDKQLRMTKEELKQEMKDAETSPELKAAQAARRRRLAKGRMMDAVKSADVIITNPTHYAVALNYDPEKSHAPIVVAKGADLLAARIREVAAENKVPVVPNPPLARALYRKCEIGDFVPRELFQAVAEVLAYVYRTIKQVRGAATES